MIWWHFTAFAVRRYMAMVRHWPDTERHYQRALRELAELAEYASLSRTDAQGRQLWRISRPPKIRYIVVPPERAADLPNVVWIGTGRLPDTHWTEAEPSLPRGQQTRPSRGR